MCMYRLIAAAAVSFLLCLPAHASITYTIPGSSVTQSFDTLATSGTTNAWTNHSSTLPGWYLFNKNLVTPATYTGGDGGSNAGNFYSFGAVSSTDRALGGVASGGTYFGSPATGAIAGWIAFAAQNNTGGVLNSFTVGFDGEQWRNGGNVTAQTMVLEYGFGSTFATVGTWNLPGGNFDWTSPVATVTAATVDGNSNLAGLQSGRGGTISSLTWLIGDTLWIRWVERNDNGNDHGLAIDDFSFSASRSVTPGVIPEPASLLVWGGVGLLGLAVVALKKKAA